MIKRITLAIDVGSSSIRCSAYESNVSNEACTNETVVQPKLRNVNGCSSSKKISSVRANSGKIILFHNHLYEKVNNPSLHESSTLVSILDVIDSCVDETLSLLRLRYDTANYQVVGVGITSFVMNLVGVDKNGDIVSEDSTFSYACNSAEVAHECEVLKKDLGEEKLNYLYQNTGAPIHSAYALPQLRVYYRTLTSNRSSTNVTSWQTLSNLCLLRWLGKAHDTSDVRTLPISYSEASWTGLFNFHSCTWEKECLALLPKECNEALPNIENSTDCFSMNEYSIYPSNHMKNPYWERWPDLRNCKFVLGVGDGACANIGSKCTFPKRIAVTIGTSAAARVCLSYPINHESNKSVYGDKFTVPYGLFCYRINNSHVLLGGALTDGGSVVEWIRQLLNLKDDNDFENCLSDVTASYEKDTNHVSINTDESIMKLSLAFVPFLSGERSTGFRSSASGCIIALNRNTSPSDIVRTCLEGVILRLDAVIKLMNQVTVHGLENSSPQSAACIVASGNALEKNLLWRRMLADCSQIQIVKDYDSNEGTSRGIAIITTDKISKYNNSKNNDSFWMTGEELNVEEDQEPNINAEKYWNRSRLNQTKIIENMTPLWK